MITINNYDYVKEMIHIADQLQGDYTKINFSEVFPDIITVDVSEEGGLDKFHQMIKDNPFGILFVLCRKKVKCPFSHYQLSRYINVSRELTKRGLGGEKMVILLYDPMSDNTKLIERLNRDILINKESGEDVTAPVTGSANLFYFIDGRPTYFMRHYLRESNSCLTEDQEPYQRHFKNVSNYDKIVQLFTKLPVCENPRTEIILTGNFDNEEETKFYQLARFNYSGLFKDNLHHRYTWRVKWIVKKNEGNSKLLFRNKNSKDEWVVSKEYDFKELLKRDYKKVIWDTILEYQISSYDLWDLSDDIVSMESPPALIF